jgi:hypothetical protein
VKIFISWSGETSKQVALVLDHILPAATNAETFMSDQSIGTGTAWQARLNDELAGTNFGIACLTPDNLTAPWLHYEAGALGKLVGDGARLVPFLFEVERSSVQGGLAGFNNCRASEREDLKKLFRAIDEASDGATLTESQLETRTGTWWPALSERLGDVHEPSKAKSQPRETHEILEEILALVRAQDVRPGRSTALEQDRGYSVSREQRGAIARSFNRMWKLAKAEKASLSPEMKRQLEELRDAVVAALPNPTGGRLEDGAVDGSASTEAGYNVDGD